MDVGAFVETLNKVVTDMDWTSSGSYVTVAVVVGIALMLYTSLGSFTPATKRRAAITVQTQQHCVARHPFCWNVDHVIARPRAPLTLQPVL